ncbi:MAG: cyclic nucleotide-binding domain-containing protein [Sandaracinus sp.]
MTYVADLLARCVPGLDAPLRARLEPYLGPRSVERGTIIVREGAETDDMYFVTGGEARVTRGDLELMRVGEGDHFGELALLAARPRSASVIAITDVSLLCLEARRYRDLVREEPDLAVALVHELVGGISDRLSEMTERVGVLVRERSLPRRTSIEVRTDGIERRVALGTPVLEILPKHADDGQVVAALIDHKPASLATLLSADATVAPLTTGHWEGERIRRASVGLVLLEAARTACPRAVLRLGPSQGATQLVELTEACEPDVGAMAAKLEAAMRELVAKDVPITNEWWTVEEASSYFAEVGASDIVALLETWRDAMVPVAICGETRVLALGPLLPRAAMIGFFQLIADRGRLVVVHGEHHEDRVRQLRPAADAMQTEHAVWLRKLGIANAGTLARACVRGDITQVLRVSEGFQEKRISRIADEIAGRNGRVKVISVAGPSSSGKTTFIQRLSVQLQVLGIHPIGLSLDDYYVDREKTPLAPDGTYDYEAFEALDASMLQDELTSLLRGEAVKVARFDFKSGKSLPGGGRELRLRSEDVLLVEGIHGLNPRLLGDRLDHDEIFRVFVCPLTTLSLDSLTRMAASDLRLIRRIVRDRHGRATTASDTIARWPSVRSGERKHIFPFFDQADAVFDSALIYEPSVLKVYAERYLLEVPQQHPSFQTAWRLLSLLSRFVAIQPDEIPRASILREFIGGSGFES